MASKLTTCASCGQEVSNKAYDCPHCGHPLRKPKRGFFGFLFKWTFIVFNVLMLVWLIGSIGSLSELSNDLESEAEQVGAAIGGTIGMAFLFGIWVIGDIILGLLVLLTRPRK